MTNRRPPKKSAMLEVRLSHEAKEALMARCREQGVSASEFVRQHIEDFVAGSEPRSAAVTHRSKVFTFPALDALLDFVSRPQAAIAAVAMAFGMVVLASPSTATPDLQALFERFDFDGDGALTPGEFDLVQQDDKYVLAPSPEPIAVPVPVNCGESRHDEAVLEGGPDEPDVQGLTPEQEARLRALDAHDARQEQAQAFAARMAEQAVLFQTIAFSEADRDRLKAETEAMADEAERQADLMEAEIERAAELAEARAERIAEARFRRNDTRGLSEEALQSAFAALDRNADGRVTPEDFGRGGAHVRELISGLDRNGDGVVTREEFQCPRRGAA